MQRNRRSFMSVLMSACVGTCALLAACRSPVHVLQLWDNKGLLAANTFDLPASGAKIGPIQFTANAGSAALFYRRADFDGDGADEVLQGWDNDGKLALILYDLSPSGLIQLWDNSGRLGMIVYRGTESGLSQYWNTNDGGSGAGAVAFLPVDVDGDNDTDILQLWSNAGKLAMILHVSNGNSYSISWWRNDLLQGAGAIGWIVGDIDNDQRSDVTQLWDNAGRLAMIVYSARGGEYRQTWAHSHLGASTSASSFLQGDFNGDGRSDLLQVQDVSATLRVTSYLSDGTGYVARDNPAVSAGAPALAWLAVDVSGDGRTDLVQPWFTPARDLGFVVHLAAEDGTLVTSTGASLGSTQRTPWATSWLPASSSTPTGSGPRMSPPGVVVSAGVVPAVGEFRFPARASFDWLSLGICRSNWLREHDAVLLDELDHMAAQRMRSVRVTIEAAAGAERFSRLAAEATSRGMGVLVNLLPNWEDYDVGASMFGPTGPEFTHICGWEQGAFKLSTVNIAKFKQRVQTYVDALRQQAVRIDGFEVGNELDWMCFNGDIDWTRPQDAQTTLTTARAISAFLRAINEVVKQPEAFPEAQIVLGGMANLWKCSNCSGRFLDARELYHFLANVDGVDVIARYADGVGLHLYPPDSNELSDWVDDVVSRSWDALSPSARKPLWITEWGFKDTITGGETRRLELFEQVIDTLNARPEPLGYGYIYNFDEDGLRFNLYDPSTHTLREPAEIFTHRPL